VGLILTAFAMVSGTDTRPSQLAGSAAIGVLCTLIGSFAFEARGGIKNLVRADLLGVVALYYLTLYEFLFPQPYFDVNMGDIQATYRALWAVLIGFAGLFIGRHLLPRGRQPFERIMTGPIHPGWLVAIFWASFFLGFLHMLMAVNFDIEKMFDAMTRVRFDRPWARGKFGDWKALLNELSLLLYLIPPITGLMLARRDRYSFLNILLALLGFAWVLFYGFTDGTRTVFGAYLVTFMISFMFASPPARRREAVIVCAACAAAMALSTQAMLEMRTIGFKRWWQGEKSFAVNRYNSSVFVDDNLLAIAKITQFFPSRNHGRYLGFEIPYLALVRPIPRAIWPGKPKGMSMSIEQALGATQMTVAATFVGEAYISGGLFGVVLEALILGLMAAWWNRLASPRNSELGILVYASGFFAVTITMRSTFALTTALLPCIAGIVFGKFLLPKVRERLRPRPLLPPGLRIRKPNAPPVEPPLDS
jgi:oligosaccharide repeat unit polymerase